MRRTFSAVALVLSLAGAVLAPVGGPGPARAQARARPRAQAEAPRVYEGRISDVRPVWGVLILTVGEGREAHEVGFDISQGRIVGPGGSEWRGENLHVGDRVRVELTPDRTLVQQVRVLAD
jgi:hypothetical protein